MKAADRLDHRPLLKVAVVRSWYDQICLRSQLSAEVNVRRLGLFLSQTSLSAPGLVRVAREQPDELRDLITRHTAQLKGAKRLNSYIRKIHDTVRSFIAFNHVETRGLFPKIKVNQGVSLVNERTPTPDELRQLLAALSLRGKVVALMMAHAGVRPGVLANTNGTGGLTLGDLPELDIQSLEFKRVPFLIRVPEELSKIGRPYVTFGSPELAETITTYLRSRSLQGKNPGTPPLGKESPLIATSGAGGGKGAKTAKPAGEFVSNENMTFYLRQTIRAVRPGGQTFRPYALRAYFSTQMLIAESRGKITRDAREEMMGHDLGVSGRYNLSKKLGQETLDELRAQYERASEFLATSVTPQKAQTSRTLVRMMLMLSGYTETELDRAGELTEEKALKMVEAKQREEKGRSGAPDPAKPSRPGEQRVVPNDIVEQWLSAGWEFVSALGADRAVLRAGA